MSKINENYELKKEMSFIFLIRFFVVKNENKEKIEEEATKPGVSQPSEGKNGTH